MTSPLLIELDRQIAHAEARLSKLRDARTAVVEAFNLAPSQPAAAAAPASTAKTPKVRPTTRGSAGGDAETRVLAFLERQTAPVARVTVIKQVKAPTHQVIAAIDALVASKRIARRGERRGLRLGTPNVMAAAAASEED